ncbi:hypothetical protein KC19_3G236100 [Ceratodon purpureus]|uniref:Conserved oligomeric Golgi complex subunit 7 n=1 Tax=Ceratodon purpureus TaxID=3225 RepID=A0A8T0IM37_CERPU|nr:hypothetical protein KC19_3G236100 [Ceratodon purpureus]
MMLDLASFGDDKFHAKAWVNAACKSRHPDDSLDKYLGDLEMKLQLMAENIAASLEEQSAQALLRVPRASRDVFRVRDDALSLRSTVSAVLHKLQQAEGTSAESVAALARVDAVKQRMEAAHETLQDAAGLAKLSASVEDVFASGNLPQAAETLAQMRRCLAVVGEVPEFANVKRQLEGLEDRLEGMVQPRLADALTQRKVDSTQGLRDILITVGRYKSLEQHYTRVRMRPLKRLWEDFEAAKVGIPLAKPAATDSTMGGDRRPATMSSSANGSTTSFAEWLPHYYDEVLLVLEQELKWCMVAFPEDYQLLVPRLLIETMNSISASFVTRIDTFTSEATAASRALNGAQVPGGEVSGEGNGRFSTLGLLIGLHSVSESFSKNVLHLLSAIDVAELARVLQAIYQPFEGYKQRYGELERIQLLGEISALDLRGAVSRGFGQRGVELSETVRRMEASIPEITIALEAAVERCISFTGGVEAESLLRTLDEVILHYLASLLDILKSLRAICGVDRILDFLGSNDLSNLKKDAGLLDGAVKKEGGAVSSDVVPEEEEWSIVQGALQLLTVAEGLSSRSAVFEASLRATLSRLSTSLQPSRALTSSMSSLPFTVSENEESDDTFAGPMGLDITMLRLISSPEKAKRLAGLLEQVKDPQFHALPHTSQRVAAFTEAVNELVYEVLMSKVRTKLSDLARETVWNEQEKENLFNLPSFSAYASEYVTSIGEYLLTLPQQLLPLAGSGSPEGVDEGSDDAQYFATEWMFKVAEGAIAAYIEQIRGIQALSERGAQQLSADIEYLSNVLSALSMSTPPVLHTFQVCVSAPRNKLAELAEQEGIDNATFRLVCKMRQVKLESA